MDGRKTVETSGRVAVGFLTASEYRMSPKGALCGVVSCDGVRVLLLSDDPAPAMC